MRACPYRQDGYWYYTRTEKGKAYPIYCRKKGTLEAPEEIMLDQNALAEGKEFHAFGGMDVSPDGRSCVYLEDLTAFREYTLYVKDLASGKIVESIPNVWNGTAWADDNKTFFYMTADAAKRGNAVWRHVVGTPREQDVKVFQEDDVLNNVAVFRTRSGKFVVHSGRQLHLVRVARDPDGGAGRGAARHRRRGGRTSSTRWTTAAACSTSSPTTTRATSAIVRARRQRAGALEWKDWAPHRAEAFVEGVDVFKRLVVVVGAAQGLRQLRVIDLADQRLPRRHVPESGLWRLRRPATPSSTPTCSASTIRRWSRRRPCSTTTWPRRPAS